MVRCEILVVERMRKMVEEENRGGDLGK